ncbi:hypothetical protein SAMN05444366_0084 [Flavobacterium saccharophilum]|uniref:Uncharacterized protein n=1 Tax=Flavobacterium saccharophilum TaxID=29534 RepID=A0A1M6Z1U2_9FLAO|nr:hypothetical protein SAMN05444366_0084 [Flavobacterium saccharophilum]
MVSNLRPEIKTVLFFVIYFILFLTIRAVQPTGSPHGPNLSDIFFLLSIPISIIYTIILLYKYFKSGSKNYLSAIFVVTMLWILFYNSLKFIY